jgi:hypothetical protein
VHVEGKLRKILARLILNNWHAKIEFLNDKETQSNFLRLVSKNYNATYNSTISLHGICNAAYNCCFPQSPPSASVEKLRCCPSTPSSVEVILESRKSGLPPCWSASNVACYGFSFPSYRWPHRVLCWCMWRQCWASVLCRDRRFSSSHSAKCGTWAGYAQGIAGSSFEVPSAKFSLAHAFCKRLSFGSSGARSYRNPIQGTSCLHFGHIARFCRAMLHTDEPIPLDVMLRRLFKRL